MIHWGTKDLCVEFNTRRLISQISWLVFVGLFPVCGPAQVVRNELSVATNTDPNAERLYIEIQANIAANNFARAAANIERLRSQFASVLIPVAARHQLEATLLADMLISTMPESEFVTPLTASAHSHTGVVLWQDLITKRRSEQELMQSGDQYWRDGRVETAQMYWRIAGRGKPSLDVAGVIAGPDLQVASAEVLKRLIVAKLFQGDFRQASLLLDVFAANFPDIVGRLAAKTGRVLVLLRKLEASLRGSKAHAFLDHQNFLPFEVIRFNLKKTRWSLAVDQPPSSPALAMPSHWKDFLIVHDQTGVRARLQSTGNAAWPVDATDEGYLFETMSHSAEAPLVIGDGVVENQLWIGRTGVTSIASRGGRNLLDQSRIVLLNLDAEGRLEWTVTADELSRRDHNTRQIFSGPPITVDGRIYVPVRTAAPDDRLEIVCLNAVDGTQLWGQQLGASLTIPAAGHSTYDRLASADGLICWTVDGLTTFCVDAESGRVQWVSGIEPIIDSEVSQRTFSDEILISEGQVLSTSRNGVNAYDLYSGQPIWKQLASSSPGQLLGLNDGLLIVASPGLSAIDCVTGKIVWHHRNLDASFSAARGELVGRSILWPAGGEILTIDAQTGRILQRDAFTQLTGRSIEALQLIDQTLFVNDGKFLTACDVELIRER